MCGKELVEQIRKVNPVIPVIMLSTGVMKEDVTLKKMGNLFKIPKLDFGVSSLKRILELLKEPIVYYKKFFQGAL